LNESEKKQWEAKAAKDKERYHAEMVAYMNKA